MSSRQYGAVNIGKKKNQVIYTVSLNLGMCGDSNNCPSK